MSSFLRFNGAVRHQSKIDEWFDARPADLGAIARAWFAEMRNCGQDVTELLHDGHPTACVEDAAFGYVNVFTSHVNIGFFHGATLDDPARLLLGSGRFMRHVKARPGSLPDETSLKALIRAAYVDIKKRLAAEHSGDPVSRVVLRQATMADADSLWRVRYAVKENTLAPGRLSNEDLRRELEDTGRGWVVEIDGTIEGFAIGNAQSGNIWALFVLPEAEGRGYGTRLHDVMIDWLRQQHVPLLWLTTDQTSRAAGFYEKRGWKRVGILSDGQARYELPDAA